jgi:sulfur relay (sulfurtransferase) DsrC/TusE family protein
VTTKELYVLFPRAPGRTIASIAGLPKPAGCL